MFTSRTSWKKVWSHGPRKSSVVNTGPSSKTVPPVTLRVDTAEVPEQLSGLHLQGTMSPSSPDLNPLDYFLWSEL